MLPERAVLILCTLLSCQQSGTVNFSPIYGLHEVSLACVCILTSNMLVEEGLLRGGFETLLVELALETSPRNKNYLLPIQ